MLICSLGELVIQTKVEHILNLSPSPGNVYENMYTYMYFLIIAEIMK